MKLAVEFDREDDGRWIAFSAGQDSPLFTPGMFQQRRAGGGAGGEAELHRAMTSLDAEDGDELSGCDGVWLDAA